MTFTTTAVKRSGHDLVIIVYKIKCTLPYNLRLLMKLYRILANARTL